MREALREYIKKMPKTELHIHLLGAIPLETLWSLVKKYKGTSEIASIDQLRDKYQFRDFLHFIDIWIWQQQFIREYDDLELIASHVALDMIEQNIRYAEVFYTTSSHAEWNLSPSEVTKAILKGFARHKKYIELKLIHDFGRNRGPEDAMGTLRKLKDMNCPDLIGIGIGGPEEGYPPEPFLEVYRQARSWGFKTNAHAGEAAGAKSVWGAVKTLEADRIGHATRAFEDPVLVEYLKEKQIPLEMNPVSNCRTQVVSSIKSHPIKDYFEKGLMVTVNSDDPKMFHTSLENEYYILVKELGFSEDNIKQLLHNSIHAAWCDSSKKARLIDEVESYFSDNAFPEGVNC